MKRRIFGLGAVFFFLCMLIAPKAVFSGASEGLLLWFQIVLPTLSPFLIISNFLLISGNMRYITDALGSLFIRLFRVSEPGSYCVLVGFLCGYPMGAKTAADMVQSKLISREEGEYLLSFCNNTSPSFIMNYLVLKALHKETLMLPTIGILFLTQVLVSFITRRNLPPQTGLHTHAPVPVSKSAWSLRYLDKCITDSAETLVKVGGYIILFSVLLSLLRTVPLQIFWFDYVLSFLEITNGIYILGNAALPFYIRYALLLGLTASGGLCSIAQTQCMIQDAHLPILPYITEKLAAALTASLLGILYLSLF